MTYYDCRRRWQSQLLPEKLIDQIHPPPRFILGASLMFWGAMTDRLWIGVPLGLLIEAAFFIRTRWDFNHASFSRAWQFSAISSGLAAILIWLDGSRLNALPMLITWLPMLLIPTQFVQSYGTREAIPLNTFSFFAKQRRLRNRRLGLIDSEISINFGNLYFIINLVAAALGSHANNHAWTFLLGSLLLAAWMLHAHLRSSFISMIAPLCIVGGLTVAGQKSLDYLEQWASGSGGGSGSGESKFNPNWTTTLIGKPGKVQQSTDLIWRLRPAIGNPPPKLLRTATYQQYRSSRWENQRLAISDFKDLVTLEITQGEPYFIVATETDAKTIRRELPHFNLRGAASAETPLPLPSDTASLRDFVLDGVERNRFGTVRVFPKESIIEGTILWRSEFPMEIPATNPQDLKIDRSELSIIHQIAQDIGLLENAPLASKLKLLQGWFAQNYRYSRELTINRPAYLKNEPSGIEQFLTTQRSGHCEYFATAATLLLRESGIPARYAIGYIVSEHDGKRQEFTIRGTHAHAWCRVWDETNKCWNDFDPTPGINSLTVLPPLPWTQSLNDTITRIREDFFLWRNQPTHRFSVKIGVSILAIGALLWIGLKLWRSKKQPTSDASFYPTYGSTLRTPLHDLEPSARRHLGQRAHSQPYCQWLLGLRSLMPNPAALDEAVRIHQRLRFAPETSGLSESKRLAELLKLITANLKRS